MPVTPSLHIHARGAPSCAWALELTYRNGMPISVRSSEISFAHHCRVHNIAITSENGTMHMLRRCRHTGWRDVMGSCDCRVMPRHSPRRGSRGRLHRSRRQPRARLPADVAKNSTAWSNGILALRCCSVSSGDGAGRHLGDQSWGRSGLGSQRKRRGADRHLERPHGTHAGGDCRRAVMEPAIRHVVTSWSWFGNEYVASACTVTASWSQAICWWRASATDFDSDGTVAGLRQLCGIPAKSSPAMSEFRRAPVPQRQCSLIWSGLFAAVSYQDYASVKFLQCRNLRQNPLDQAITFGNAYRTIYRTQAQICMQTVQSRMLLWTARQYASSSGSHVYRLEVRFPHRAGGRVKGKAATGIIRLTRARTRFTLALSNTSLRELSLQLVRPTAAGVRTSPPFGLRGLMLGNMRRRRSNAVKAWPGQAFYSGSLRAWPGPRPHAGRWQVGGRLVTWPKMIASGEAPWSRR